MPCEDALPLENKKKAKILRPHFDI